MISNSRLFAICAGLFLSGLAIPAQAQGTDSPAQSTLNEDNLAIAREIVNLGFPIETREAIFFASVDQVVAQMREASLQAYGLDGEENAEILAILDEWTADYVDQSKNVLRAHIPSLMDGLAASYSAIFTRQELLDIRAFVSTPSGQRYFELGPAVVAESHFANANQQYMNDVQAQLPAALDDLRVRIEALLAEKQEAELQVTR